jgi:hypothetical protein
MPMTWMIAAGFLMVAWMGWSTIASAIAPNTVGRPAQDIAREQELLRQLQAIDRQLPDDFWRRYDQLVSMRKVETLQPDSPEHGELMSMTNELECRHADRLVLLSELATLRGTSLAEVMQHDDIAVWNHG